MMNTSAQCSVLSAQFLTNQSRLMKINATIRTDDDDRMFAEISADGLLIDVITDNGDMSQSMRQQVEAWAAANGHTVNRVEVLA